MGEHQRVMRGNGLELVGGGGEGQSRKQGDLRGKGIGKTGMGIEAGADRRCALGKGMEAGEGCIDPLLPKLDLRGIAG